MSLTFRSLYPLPGSIDSYLVVLQAILAWLSSTGQPSYEAFVTWLAAQYGGKRSTLGNYIQTLIRLETVALTAGGQLTVTELGHQLLASDIEAQARRIAAYLLPRYVGLREILSVYAQANTELHLDQVMATLRPQYPTWKTPVPFYERLRWLVSLHCLDQVTGRSYRITPLGSTVLRQFQEATPRESVRPVSVPALPSEPFLDVEVAELISELRQAALDSATPRRLEAIITHAFRFLGFDTEVKGGSGDTDILIQASIGPHSYSAVVDAKARRDGRVQELNVYTLQEHQQRHQANYAMVVAESFAGGKLERHAVENGLVLMSCQRLVEWLQLHQTTPLNLFDYRSVFTQPGLLKALPDTLQAARARRLRSAQLLAELVALMHGIYQQGLQLALPDTQLSALLAKRLPLAVRPEEVQEVVSLLMHPAIAGAFSEGTAGICLAMPLTSVTRTLRALADLLDSNRVG